jgi:hypothetical protein
MKFRYNEDNGDPRYAGKSFPATRGHWDGEAWVPGADHDGHRTLLVQAPGFGGQWSPVFDDPRGHESAGEILKTQTIAGREITLKEGENYLASRPMGFSEGGDWPVTIISGGDWGKEVAKITGLSFDESDAFIGEFNNDPRGSFYGRVW